MLGLQLFSNFDIEIANPYKPWSSLCYGILFQEDFNVHLTPVTKAFRLEQKYQASCVS